MTAKPRPVVPLDFGNPVDVECSATATYVVLDSGTLLATGEGMLGIKIPKPKARDGDELREWQEQVGSPFLAMQCVLLLLLLLPCCWFLPLRWRVDANQLVRMANDPIVW